MTTFRLKIHHFILGALLTLLLVRPTEAANSMNFDMGKKSATATAVKASKPARDASIHTTTKVIEKIVCEGSKDSGVLHFTGKNLDKPSADLADGKLVLIFKDTRLAIPRKIKGSGLVREIRSSAHKDKSAWVVIDENGARHYTIDVVDSGLMVRLSAEASVSANEKTVKKTKASATKTVVAKTMVSPKSDSQGAASLKTYARLLDASLRPESGSLKIVFTADSPARYTVRKLSTPEKLVLRFNDTHLDVPAKEKEIRGDTKLTESSGLLSLEIRQIGQNFSPISEAILTLVPGTNYQVDRNLNQVVITLTPPPPVERAVAKKGNLNQLISAELDQADLGAVLTTLGDQAGFDVDLSSAPVTGTVSEKFKNISLKDALAVLLAPGNYNYEIQGNVLRIGNSATLATTKLNMPQVTEIIHPAGGMTPDQLDSLVRPILSPTNAIKTQTDTVRNVLILHGTASDVAEYKRALRDLKLEPGDEADRINRVVKLNYADPVSVMGLLKTYLTPVGHVQVDTRTDDLIIWEVPENMGVLLELVKELDVKAPQVLIESNLVEVSDERDLNLGIQWNINKTQGDTVSSSANMLPTNLSGNVTGPPQFTFGTVKDDAAISAELQALETQKKAKIISRPRIATVSGVPAEIQTVQQVIVQTITSNFVQGVGENQTTTYSEVPVPISLMVTPRITDDGRITTQMAVTVTSITGSAPAGAPPPTTVESALTTVTTKNGETIVIGGLVQDSISEEEDGVPLLEDLPIVGALFQSKSHVHQKQELIIFVTPTLIED